MKSKRIMIMRALLIGGIIFIMGCEGKRAEDNHLYVNGWMIKGGRNTPMFWKDSVQIVLPSGDFNAEVLDVCADGKNVYAVGYVETDTLGEILYPLPTATLWRNGIMKTLTYRISKAFAVHVSDKQVYVVGYTRREDHRVATLWIDGKEQQLSDRFGEDAQARDVCVVNGKVYVVGDKTIDYHRSAMLWKDGEAILLADTSDRCSIATAVKVVDGRIIIGGTVKKRFYWLPVLWVDGKRILLAEEQKHHGQVLDIDMFEGKVVAVGARDRGGGSCHEDSMNSAVLWYDGKERLLSSDTTDAWAYNVQVKDRMIHVSGIQGQKMTRWIEKPE